MKQPKPNTKPGGSPTPSSKEPPAKTSHAEWSQKVAQQMVDSLNKSVRDEHQKDQLEKAIPTAPMQ